MRWSPSDTTPNLVAYVDYPGQKNVTKKSTRVEYQVTRNYQNPWSELFLDHNLYALRIYEPGGKGAVGKALNEDRRKGAFM